MKKKNDSEIEIDRKGFLHNTEDEEAEIRGATAEEMKSMTNEKIIMVVLYRLLVAEGFDDSLCDELKKRITQK